MTHNNSLHIYIRSRIVLCQPPTDQDAAKQDFKVRLSPSVCKVATVSACKVVRLLAEHVGEESIRRHWMDRVLQMRFSRLNGRRICTVACGSAGGGSGGKSERVNLKADRKGLLDA